MNNKRFLWFLMALLFCIDEFSMEKRSTINEEDSTVLWPSSWPAWKKTYIPDGKKLISVGEKYNGEKLLSFMEAYQNQTFLISDSNGIICKHYEDQHACFEIFASWVARELAYYVSPPKCKDSRTTVWHLHGMAALENNLEKKTILLQYINNFTVQEKLDLQCRRFREYLSHYDTLDDPNEMKQCLNRMVYQKAFINEDIHTLKKALTFDLGPRPLTINAYIQKMIDDINNDQFQPPIFKKRISQ